MKNKKRNSTQNNNTASQCDNNQSNSDSQKSKLCCFSSTDYIILASTLAIALGEELSQTDLNILSTFFAVLSDELALIATVQGCNTGDEDVFVPPVPDVATTSINKITPSKNQKRRSKVVKRKRK